MVLEELHRNIADVRAGVDHALHVSNRSQHVTLLAATKYVDAQAVRVLVEAGIRDVGENRLDALRKKQGQLGTEAGLTWHFIGRLQSRKVRDIASRVSYIHTLCTASAAEQLGKVGPSLPQIFVQVNIGEDPSKDGLSADEVEDFIAALPDHVCIAGLSTMPPFVADSEQNREAFAGLRDLRDRLVSLVDERHSMSELSMGTSQDFPVAVQEGATIVRLGRVLYAPRG